MFLNHFPSPTAVQTDRIACGQDVGRKECITSARLTPQLFHILRGKYFTIGTPIKALRIFCSIYPSKRRPRNRRRLLDLPTAADSKRATRRWIVLCPGHVFITRECVYECLAEVLGEIGSRVHARRLPCMVEAASSRRDDVESYLARAKSFRGRHRQREIPHADC